jgi:ESS family glutamate:Na+ symporter
MGKNYDAAVLAAGHCGFGMGATPTAVANMQVFAHDAERHKCRI